MATTNNDLMQKLGEIIADVRHGETSRKVLHDKIDQLAAFNMEQVKAMAELGEGLKTVAAVSAQARDMSEGAAKNIHRFESEFREKQLPIIVAASAFQVDAEPVLAAMRLVLKIVIAMLGAGVLSIGTVVALALWAREYLASGLRIILGL